MAEKAARARVEVTEGPVLHQRSRFQIDCEQSLISAVICKVTSRET